MSLYGVPESIEGIVMVDFINQLITGLSLPDGVSLEIQRTHRAQVTKINSN